jgi:hypothetical protein
MDLFILLFEFFRVELIFLVLDSNFWYSSDKSVILSSISFYDYLINLLYYPQYLLFYCYLYH